MPRSFLRRSLLAACALGLASAPALAVEEEIQPRNIVPPAYPPGWERVVGVECRAALQVRPNGRVHDMDLRGVCIEPFATEVRRALPRWRFERWEADDPDALRERFVTVRFMDRGSSYITYDEILTIVGAHTEAEPGGDDCRIGMIIPPTGDVEGLTTNANPDCIAIPIGGGVFPEALTSNATCSVAFRARTGSARRARIAEGCPAEAHEALLSMVTTWLWTEPDPGTPYEVTFTFAPE